jgi:hypothetical protein
MLADKYIPANAYLAYILSDVYDVDQLNYDVSGIDDGETVTGFLANITPAPGASVVIIDEDGNIKNSGNLAPTDQVKVTSSFGNVVVMYTISGLTGTGNLNSDVLRMYPNPTTGIVNISGLEPGNRIRVYNAVGTMIMHIRAESTYQRISLENRPSGLYLIEIRDNAQTIGRFKAIKR